MNPTVISQNALPHTPGLHDAVLVTSRSPSMHSPVAFLVFLLVLLAAYALVRASRTPFGTRGRRR